MRGITFVEKGRAAFTDEPMPVCAPDTLLLRTLYSGITNGTERNVLMGGNYGGTWPSRCAYQLVSRVVDAGSQVTRFRVGDVVYTGTFPGHVAYHTAREGDLIVRLPEAMDPVEAALLGVASVPMHDVRRASVCIDDNVLVVGAGLIGQLAAQAARVVGARVAVADVDPGRLALAQSLGADAVADPSAEAGHALLHSLRPFSVVVECSGADVLGALLGGAGAPPLIGQRARVLLIAGRHEVAYSFNAGQFAEVAVLHASHFFQEDLEHVVRHVMKGTIRIRPLITKVVPIEEALGIYETLRDRPNDLLGTVFVWEE